MMDVGIYSPVQNSWQKCGQQLLSETGAGPKQQPTWQHNQSKIQYQAVLTDQQVYEEKVASGQGQIYCHLKLKKGKKIIIKNYNLKL
jgi:hypothetical protein